MRHFALLLAAVLLPALAEAQPVVEVIVPDEARAVLKKHFPAPGENEMGWCVGRIGISPAEPGVTIRLLDVKPGQIHNATPRSVNFSCENAAILLHSHPYGHCQPSMDDYKWAVGVWMVWGIQLTGVVCGPDHVRLVQLPEALAMVTSYVPVRPLLPPR